jgi:hypothetical protein
LCLYRQSDDGKEDGSEGMFHNHFDVVRLNEYYFAKIQNTFYSLLRISHKVH